MGVKNLWSVLTPYAERKPISELRGKTIAIDLAGWVCESLNVVDYFVHPRHHLKNLFFRTCYLLWEEVTPVFILEGVAPRLKCQVIEKRNEMQFRGAKPKGVHQSDPLKQKGDKGRTRFNHVLKQCEILLQSMGVQCLQGPGEAEAYCAFLNLKGVCMKVRKKCVLKNMQVPFFVKLVDGVISQDSDCFAYGALRVYRNFSISSQGALAANGGAVDIYDMNNIRSKIDFGQNKVIVMALLCGCDYCPDGIGGVGRDSVLKLFQRYKDDEILKHVSSWRFEDKKYSTLEMRVDDKTICSNCGHIGRTQSHTKNGCGVCRTTHGCDESLWKEERLSLKAELTLRRKALADSTFPSDEIITEFLKQPKEVPKLHLRWREPNMVKFIKQTQHLLQWPEIYCFQKFFPIYTRWLVLNSSCLKDISSDSNCVKPKEIIKKRVVKSVPCLEVLWIDENGIFNGLIPESQLKEFLISNPNGTRDIWTTIEPFDKVKIAYPELVESFLESTEKSKRIHKKLAKTNAKLQEQESSGALQNLSGLIEATKEVGKSLKSKKQAKPKKNVSKHGLQMIDKFFKQKNNAIEKNQKQNILLSSNKYLISSQQCSTPLTKSIPSDLESDIEDIFDMSDIVNGIVNTSHNSFSLNTHKGKQLRYEGLKQDISALLSKDIASGITRSIDDLEIFNGKRTLSNSFYKTTYKDSKRVSLDDSFDVLVKKGICRNSKNVELAENHISNVVDRFKQKHRITTNILQNHSEVKLEDEKNVSYFFTNSFELENEDIFEKVMEASIAK